MVEVMAARKTRSRTRYTPPSVADRHRGALGDLLEGTGRVIPDTQQARLGFDDRQRGSTVYYSGSLELLQRRCVAIVGTRKVSEDGAKRARRLAKELARVDVVVASGLAMGVDTEAMTAAVKSGGKLIGVIGTGMDRATPVASSRLQETIYREHLLMSPFEFGSQVYRGNFPTRNKLMAAVSDATVIVEASDSSGTLHQAAECQRLGRWLFIMRSVANDPKLTWPESFLSKPRCEVLESTEQLLERIGHEGG